MKVAYINLLQKNLKIFGIGKSKNLADYVTTEKDVQRGNNRMPMNLARQTNEDLMKDHTSAPNDGMDVDSIFQQGDIGQNVNDYNQAHNRRQSNGVRPGDGDTSKKENVWNR